MPLSKSYSTLSASIIGIEYTEGEDTFPDLPLKVIDGNITLDDASAPYVEANLTVALPAEDYLEQINPRTGLRGTLTATQQWAEPTKPDQTRSFDLLLDEREIDHVAKTLRLVFRSDEALLINGGLVGTVTERTYGVSVKDAVEYTLDTISATLEAGAEDADLTSNTLDPVLTNLVPNPTHEVGTASTVNASGNNTITRSTAQAWTGTSSLAATALGSGAAGAVFCDLAAKIPATAGTTYTFSLYARSTAVKSGVHNIRFYNAGGVAIGTDPTTSVSYTTGEWTRFSITATAPAGTAFLYPYSYAASATAGQVFYYDGAMVTEGSTEIDYFDGATLNGRESGIYETAWTGTAHNSASTLTNLPNSDATVWEPGIKAWEFAEPIVRAGGLRLFCDEERTWRLVNPSTYTVSGSVSVAEGINAVAGTDLISLGRSNNGVPLWSTGIVVRYRWTDAEGLTQTTYDSAGTGENVYRLDVNTPYPGPGRAAAMLALAEGRGRTQDLTALMDLKTTPGQQLVSTMPGTPVQVGIVSSVKWHWSADSDDSGLMDVTSRGLIDTPETAWLFQPDDYAWDDIPTGQDWTEYETPTP